MRRRTRQRAYCKAQATLIELGRLNVSDVARTLYSRGIKGIAGDPLECPIARYLYQETGLKFSVIWSSAYLPGETFDVIATPATVRMFISQFDSGVYQRLRA